MEITPADEEPIIQKYLGRQKNVTRRERKIVLGRENEGNKIRQNLVLYLALAGIMLVFGIYYMTKLDWVLVILVYVGLMMFLPIGMLLGWALLDPYMRCKIIRRATKKNYGIVNFVGKGQKIVSKIKNFDDSLIWRGNSVWVITREHIYQLSKNGDRIVETGKIEAESIVSLVETVPVLFVDLDSMQPLSLARDRREGINPLELGPALKAWVDNEKAKALGLKKNIDLYFVVIIICSIVAVGLAYYDMSLINQMTEKITVIQGKLDMVLERLAPVVTP